MRSAHCLAFWGFQGFRAHLAGAAWPTRVPRARQVLLGAPAAAAERDWLWRVLPGGQPDHRQRAAHLARQQCAVPPCTRCRCTLRNQAVPHQVMLGSWETLHAAQQTLLVFRNGALFGCLHRIWRRQSYLRPSNLNASKPSLSEPCPALLPPGLRCLACLLHLASSARFATFRMHVSLSRRNVVWQEPSALQPNRPAVSFAGLANCEPPLAVTALHPYA